MSEIINMLECSECHGHEFDIYSSAGGCDSCGYGAYTEINCVKCKVDIRLD